MLKKWWNTVVRKIRFKGGAPRFRLHHLLMLIPLIAVAQLFFLRRNALPGSDGNAVSIIVPIRSTDIPNDFLSGLFFNSSEHLEVIYVGYSFLKLAELQRQTARYGVRVISATPHGTVFRKQVPTFAEMVNVGIRAMSGSSRIALVMAPTHIPVTPDFVGVMKRHLEASQASMVTCTTTTSDDFGSIVVHDRGFNVTLMRENGIVKPFASRNYNGFSDRDKRTNLVEEVNMVGPYCMLISEKTLQRLHGVPFASEATNTDAILHGDIDAKMTSDAATLLRTRLARLEEILSSVSIGALKDSKESTQVAVRDAYSVILEAQKVLKGFIGEDGMKAPIPPLEANVKAVEDEYTANLNALAPADTLRYMSDLVATVSGVLNRIHHSKGSMIPEDTYGWTLSLVAKRAGLGKTIASPARALFNSQGLPLLMRAYQNVTKLQNTVSYPLETGFLIDHFKDDVRLHPAMAAVKNPVRIIWDAFCCNCCGFSNEIVHFVFPLQKVFDVSLVPESSCFCPGFPRAVDDTIARIHSARDTFPVERGQPHEIVVWVSHTDPMSYKNAVFEKRKPDYIVGRSMYEFTKIDSNWVEASNTNCDEIWVPADFVGKVFSHSGVAKSKIVVIPEAVDAYFFDPNAHGMLNLPPAGNITGKWNHWCNYPSSQAHSFYKFFSIFKWEPRKGWDVMLRAYFAAFAHEDHVSLYILTHIWFSGGPETYGDKHNTTFITEEIKRVLELDRLDDLPHFCVIGTDMPETDVARLYNSVDAFVLPTFGEGWGLPAIQAMSMALPTITTAWGGQLEFLTPNNSFMIGIDAVEEIPADSVYRWRLGKKWAVPSFKETKRLMRYVFDNPAIGVKVGARARAHIVKYFSEEAIAKLVTDRINVIREIVIKRRLAK